MAASSNDPITILIPGSRHTKPRRIRVMTLDDFYRYNRGPEQGHQHAPSYNNYGSDSEMDYEPYDSMAEASIIVPVTAKPAMPTRVSSTASYNAVVNHPPVWKSIERTMKETDDPYTNYLNNHQPAYRSATINRM